MTALDIAILAIIGLSAGVAFFRGCVREVLTIGAWVGAALLTPIGMPFIVPYMRDIITMRLLADIASGAAVFVLLLIVLTLVCHQLSKMVQSSALSPVDRALGAVFGVIRGGVIVGAGYLVIAWALADQDPPPDWFAESEFAPVVASVTDMVVGYALGAGIEAPAFPNELADDLEDAAQDIGDEAADEAARRLQQEIAPPETLMPSTTLPEEPAEEAEDEGYTEQERQNIERLFDSVN